MRCGCPDCQTYMVQAESMTLGCVCPACGRRCTDCLGTDTVVTRDALKDLRAHPELAMHFFAEAFEGGDGDISMAPESLRQRSD